MIAVRIGNVLVNTALNLTAVDLINVRGNLQFFLWYKFSIFVVLEKNSRVLGQTLLYCSHWVLSTIFSMCVRVPFIYFRKCETEWSYAHTERREGGCFNPHAASITILSYFNYQPASLFQRAALNTMHNIQGLITPYKTQHKEE